MKNSKAEGMNKEINEALSKTIALLSEKYPGHNIELLVAQNLMNKRGASIRQSEVDHFKRIAMSSLGTDNEIKFDDAERGFLKAALADGKTGLKEFMAIYFTAPWNNKPIATDSLPLLVIPNHSIH